MSHYLCRLLRECWMSTTIMVLRETIFENYYCPIFVELVVLITVISRVTHYMYYIQTNWLTPKSHLRCFLTSRQHTFTLYILYVFETLQHINNVLKSFFANLTLYTSFSEILLGFSGKAPRFVMRHRLYIYSYYIGTYTLTRVYT